MIEMQDPRLNKDLFIDCKLAINGGLSKVDILKRLELYFDRGYHSSVHSWLPGIYPFIGLSSSGDDNHISGYSRPYHTVERQKKTLILKFEELPRLELEYPGEPAVPIEFKTFETSLEGVI